MAGPRLHRENPGVLSVKPPQRHAMRDRIVAYAGVHQLSSRHDAVLALGNLRNHQVRMLRWEPFLGLWSRNGAHRARIARGV